MVEYESMKRIWILKKMVLVISLNICITSTKGTPYIEFRDSSVNHWEFLFGASSKEFLYDFCKYNGTSSGLQCKNFHPVASVDFEKVCNCTIQHNGTINDGSFSFVLSCKSDLSYCPEELTLSYKQGSYARAPPQVPIHQGIGKNNNESPGNRTGSGIEADPVNAMDKTFDLFLYIFLPVCLFIFFMSTLILLFYLNLKRNQSGLNSGISCMRRPMIGERVSDVDLAETDRAYSKTRN